MNGRLLLLAKYALDLGIWVAATPIAFWLRLDAGVVAYGPELGALLLIGVPVKAVVMLALGMPRRSWHRVGVRDLAVLLQAVGAGTVAVVSIAFFLPPTLQIPRGVPLIEALVALLGLAAVRLATRLYFESSQYRMSGGRAGAKRVLIAGAGEAGTMVAREMLRHPDAGYVPVGFLDDEPSKRGKHFVGLRVLGATDELPAVLATYRVDELLIAMPSEGGRVVRRLVDLARAAGVAHRIIPGVYELLSGRVAISEIREVDVEDLLRREPVELGLDAIAGYLHGETVLVTGAGGSIGAEIARQVAGFAPRRLLLLGRGENSVFEIDRELARTHPHVERHAIITDLRDEPSIRAVFERFAPSVVFHAAAHKHVPLMEANPEQAVFNNVGGTRNLTAVALEYRVRRFVNVSTDKAVNPTSVMGAAKRVSELVVCQASQRCRAGEAYVSVRFGNVLGSRGSVIPVFKRQIREGGPVTVTHPDMERYFMTIPEATQLVLQAAALGGNGRVYVLDMGEPVKIVDLARELILLSGKEPGVDVEIAFTGVRPGEKLFEELLMAEEGTEPSEHEKIFVAKKNGLESGRLDDLLDELFREADRRDGFGIRTALQRLVPSYTPAASQAALAPAGDGDASDFTPGYTPAVAHGAAEPALSEVALGPGVAPPPTEPSFSDSPFPDPWRRAG